MTPSLADKFQNLVQNAPVHLDYMANQLSKFNYGFRSRVHKHLRPKTAEIAIKLAYAMPLALILKTLPAYVTGPFGWLSTKYLISNDELLSKESKIDGLHSLAIALFADMLLLSSSNYTNETLVKFASDAGMLVASILAADILELVHED